MNMFQFLTTYRKDYTWPFVRSLALRPVPAGLQKSPGSDQNGSKYMQFEEYQDTVECRNTTLRETGRLPEGVQNNGDCPPGSGGGRWPSTTTSADSDKSPGEAKVNAQHLAALQEKHPYLFNVMKNCPPDDLINKVFNDRYRTTYMVDYGRDVEYPNLDYDRLVAISGQAGTPGLAYCPRQDIPKSKFANGDNGLVSVTKRGQNECDALTVQKPQGRGNQGGGGGNGGGKGGGGGQNDCLCGQVMDIPRYGRVATISKEGGGGGVFQRSAEESQGAGGGKGGSEKGGWGGGCGSSSGGGGGGGGAASGGGGGGGGAGGGGGRRVGKAYKLSYSTEYKDAYGKLGELIITSRLHSPRE